MLSITAHLCFVVNDEHAIEYFPLFFGFGGLVLDLVAYSPSEQVPGNPCSWRHVLPFPNRYGAISFTSFSRPRLFVTYLPYSPLSLFCLNPSPLFPPYLQRPLKLPGRSDSDVFQTF